MKLNIKQYEFKKIEISSKIIELPVETSYYFETGVRRSIKIVPIYSTWRFNLNKPEEIERYVVTCLYNSFECKIEQFEISIDRIEEIYYNLDDDYNGFVVNLFNGFFDKRNKKQFDVDLNTILYKINEIN
jgi:hypothetical protein